MYTNQIEVPDAGPEPVACDSHGEGVGALARRVADRVASRSESPEFQREVAERAAAEQRDRELALRRHLADSGFPTRAFEAVLAGALHDRRALVEARSFRRSERTILVLSGGVGCGKTCAAVWWAMQPHPLPRHLRHACSARFVDAPTLSRMPRFEEARWVPLAFAAALVIDDLGEEHQDSKGCFASDFSALMDARYRNDLPTVITTNLGPEEFRARYGLRLRDRLLEVGAFMSIREDSMRRRA